MGILAWLFAKDLKEKRIEALKKARRILLKAAREMEQKANNPKAKKYYAALYDSIKTTPILFIPGDKLQKKGFFVTLGANVVEIYSTKKAGLVPVNYIVLPAKHLFERNSHKINPRGLLTLMHEYGHLKNKAGESEADALMLNMALHLKIPKIYLLKHFAGRRAILGKLYPLYIKRIIESKRKPFKRKKSIERKRIAFPKKR